MSNDIFQLDKKELKRLKRFFEVMPKQAKYATVSVLNKQAAATREINVREIRRTMEIRSTSFVNRHLIWKKATIGNPRSIAGSTYGDRFTGWKEQEFGGSEDRNTITLGARTSNSEEKKVRGVSRLKQGKKIPSWNRWQRKGKRYKHHTKAQATVAMIHDFRRGTWKGRFIIDPRGQPGKLRNFKYGLYAKKGKRVGLEQEFNPPAKTGRNRWMSRSISTLDRGFDLSGAWREAMEFQMRKAKEFGLVKGR